MKFKLIFFTVLVIAVNSINMHIILENLRPNSPAFDPQLYEDALNAELCSKQLRYIRTNSTYLRLTFLEAGMRLPKGILDLNSLDLGNYDQCLGINHELDDSVLQGKYCMIRGPMNSNSFKQIAEANSWKDYDFSYLNEDLFEKFQQMEKWKSRVSLTDNDGEVLQSVASENIQVPSFRMALCVPKTCTTREGLRGLFINPFNLTLFNYQEEFCRFKDDKPWAPVDYVAIAILSVIGLLTIVSTSYDIWQTFILNKDDKGANTLYRSFSVYTNTKSLMTFRNNPNNLNCIDGIRAISMFWIIVGHTYQQLPPAVNTAYVLEWLFDLRSQWIIVAPFSVDTFFFLSGLLVVYTTAGKLSNISLLRKLHLFYINRLLRMFPLLAILILLQASVFHRVTDGPLWQTVARNVQNCRNTWWLTLLYAQNFINYNNMCINHSWYLAIDMHCYLISPIILFWVLSGKRKSAWTALALGILGSLVVATTYCFINKFAGWTISPVPEGGEPQYFAYYYFNTLTRAPIFFVGMIFGYIMHIFKGTKVAIPKFIALLFWLLAFGIIIILSLTTYWMKDMTWDYWIVNDLFNSFARPIWGVAIGWIIFACHHGYGGSINWLLTLDIWKLPSRVSYGMYLFHYQIYYLIQGASLTTIFFSDSYALYVYLSNVSIAFGVAFLATLLFDSPFSILFKLILGDGPKKSQKDSTTKE